MPSQALPVMEVPGKILVRGCHIPNCHEFNAAVPSLVDAWQDIITALGIQRLNELQKRIIFAITCDVDLFITAPENVGKRTAYIIPLLAHLLDKLKSGEFTPEKRKLSPFSVIVCESTPKALQLKDLLTSTFERLPNSRRSVGVPVVVLLDNIINEIMLASLAQPMDILILTAPSLLELFSRNNKPTLQSLKLKFYRTRFLIFEELGMKLYFMEKEAQQLINRIESQRSEQPMSANLQIIFSGTVWHPDQTGQICKALENRGRKCLSIFGSSLHALQYSSSVEWQVTHVTHEESKLNSLVSFCRQVFVSMSEHKIVVACSTVEVAKVVSQYISIQGGICNTIVTSDSDTSDTKGVFRRCTDWMGRVFVVVDNAWEHFWVTDATCLIHYDIETPTSSTAKGDNQDPFCPLRFSSLWHRMEQTWDRFPEPNGVTYFLVSGHEPNFLALYKLLQSRLLTLPGNLIDIVEKKWERNIMGKLLCTNFKCFAFCNQVGCIGRHEISQEDLDNPADAPDSGELEFKVVQSVNPSLYVAKLLKHSTVDETSGKMVCSKVYQEEESERNVQMMEYYSKEENNVHPVKVATGELVCILYSRQSAQAAKKATPGKSSRYYRAKIMDILSPGFNQFDGTKHENSSKVAEYAKIFCVDAGATLVVPLSDLLVLPDQFKNWKQLCVQLILSNVIYLEDTREYYSDALQAAKTLTEGKIWRGNVVLSLCDTVWIDSMVRTEVVSGSETNACNLREELFNGNYISVQENHNQVMVMMEYIRKRDPKFPEIQHELNSGLSEKNAKQEFHKSGDAVSWAELPLSMVESKEGKMELVPLPFTIYSWRCPWEIYGAISEGESLEGRAVKQMEEKLGQEMDNLEKGKDKCAKVFAALLQVGSVVAAKAIDKKLGNWQRAMILSRDKETQTLEVILVDYGIIATDLLELEQVLPIPKLFVEEIPFQAICLRLAHVQPIEGQTGWVEEDVARFSSLMVGKNEVNVIAFSQVHGTGNPIHCYEAMACKRNKQDSDLQATDVSLKEIGTLFVTQGYARANEKMKRVVAAQKFLDSNKSGTNTNPESLESSTSDSGSTENGKEEEGVCLEDYFAENEEDGDSEESLEMWRRFRDVDIDDDEFGANNQPEEPGQPVRDLSFNEVRTRGDFLKAIGAACLNVPGLEFCFEDPDTQVNVRNYGSGSGSGKPDVEEEEFFDAIELEDENAFFRKEEQKHLLGKAEEKSVDCESQFPPGEEEAAMLNLTNQFWKTL